MTRWVTGLVAASAASTIGWTFGSAGMAGALGSVESGMTFSQTGVMVAQVATIVRACRSSSRCTSPKARVNDEACTTRACPTRVSTTVWLWPLISTDTAGSRWAAIVLTRSVTGPTG